MDKDFFGLFCKDISDFYKDLVSGVYWIDFIDFSNLFIVFCDMMIDGG